MKKIIITFVISILLVSSLVVLAQEEMPEEVIIDESVQSEDLEVGEPTILPDSPFYFLKNIGRGIQSFFTFDPIKKAKLKEKFASEKLMELRKLNEEGKSAGIIQRATENYQKELEKVKWAVEKIKEKTGENEQTGQFLDKFIQHQVLHQRVLQKLEEQVPPQAFEKIKEARERHIERFGEVMTRLEDKKEEIKERLERNLQEVKGSEFKEFKDLEFLKNLKEKVPEKAKEVIQEIRENSLFRLKTKIEQMPSEKLESFKNYIDKISGDKEVQLEILENLKDRLEKIPELQKEIIQQRGRIQEQEKKREIEKPASGIFPGEEPGFSILEKIWEPIKRMMYSPGYFQQLGTSTSPRTQMRMMPSEIKKENE